MSRLVVKASAKRNSCQVTTAIQTAVATIPGRASGTIIRQKACSRVQPSTIADSSSSGGMLLNKAAQHPDRHRQRQRQVGQHQRRIRVDQTCHPGDLVDRDDHRGDREHLRQDDRDQDDTPSWKTEAG